MTSQNRYIPPKIQHLGEELRSHEDTTKCLQELRALYPKLNSYQSALTRLRTYLIGKEERHPDYEPFLKRVEEGLVTSYAASLGQDGTQKGDDNILNCVQFLYDFARVPLSRQLKIAHKIRKGQMKLPLASFETEMKQIPLLPEYVRRLQLTDDEQLQAKDMAIEAQHTRGSNVLHIDNPGDVVKLCITILRNPDAVFEDTCIALAVLAGRRTTETLVSGTITPIAGSAHFAYFSGQVKTGLQNIHTATTDHCRSYVIPLLGNAKLITQRLAFVQKYVRDQLGEEIAMREAVNQRYSHRLSKAVKRLIHPNFRVHDCRTLYASIAFEAFKPHNYSINVWVSKVLGHCGVGMSTHYTTMQLGGAVQRLGSIIPEFEE